MSAQRSRAMVGIRGLYIDCEFFFDFRCVSQMQLRKCVLIGIQERPGRKTVLRDWQLASLVCDLYCDKRF